MKLSRYRKPPVVADLSVIHSSLSGYHQTEHHGMVDLTILDMDDLREPGAARAKLREHFSQLHDHEIESMIEGSLETLDQAHQLRAMHEQAVDAWADRDLSRCLAVLDEAASFECGLAGVPMETQVLREELIDE